MTYQVILKSVKDGKQRIVLSESSVRENAEHYRKSWRKLLGGKSWIVDRRPGLDTLGDDLALTVERAP